MTAVIAILAVVVAVQYGVIGLYIVPRLARLADEPGVVVRAAQWGAAVFFVGCALTHVGIAIHGLSGELAGSPGHLLLAHGWPHLAQVLGGATFSYIAWKRLDVRFSHKGFEQERARAAALLAERAEQQQAVAQLGQRALHTADPAALIDEAVRLVVRTLDADFCTVLELEPSGDRLRVAAGVGWDDGVVGRVSVAADESTQAGFTFRRHEPVVVDDRQRDPRFAGHALLDDHGVVSGVTVAIRCREGIFGVLEVHAASRRRFTDDHVNFLTAVANVLANALDRAAVERQLRWRALHDELTGLPNRTLVVDRLQHALSRHGHAGSGTVAVLLVDVDDCKAVNDRFGHDGGNQLLTVLGERLRAAADGGDTVARLGGDEFVVLSEQVDGERGAVALAERLAGAWAQPIRLASGEVHVTASTGIALSGTATADSPDELLRQAEAAMRRAKTRGRGGHELFDERLRTRNLRRLEIENDLRGALERSELCLHYQPIVDLAGGNAVAVEALVRWQHPERGLLGPGEFIPIAEQCGLIAPIGAWVLREACAQVARWQQDSAGAPPLSVSVNVSGHQIARPELLLEVTTALQASGLAPGTLALEITESVLMENADAPREMLDALKATGARLVLDDFGTGYSSLSYLKRFPLDAVKIDRSFIAGLDQGDDEDVAIVAAIISLADRLGLDVVAEGVETAAQQDALRALGCGYAQGYHFGRPHRTPLVEGSLKPAPAAVA